MTFRAWTQALAAISTVELPKGLRIRAGACGWFFVALIESYLLPGATMASVPPYEFDYTGNANVGTVGPFPPQITDSPPYLGYWFVAADPTAYAQGEDNVQLSPFPKIDSDTALYVNADGVETSVSTTGSLSYYFEIDGPSGSVLVEASSFGGLQFSDISDGRLSGSASASFLVSLPDDPLDPIASYTESTDFINGALANTNLDANGMTDGSTGLLFGTGVDYYFDTNTIYEVAIATGATSSGDLTDQLNDEFFVTVFVDPQFTVLGNAAEYSVEFSPGIDSGDVTGPAAPELPTWALTIFGFGLLASAAHWARKRATVIPAQAAI